jgi:anti-sigma factor RsiW
MTATHLDDGTLVRFLDRECEAEEQTAVRGHLDGCEACAGRLARFDAGSTAFSAALQAADGQTPRAVRPAPRWGLRAAAAVLILLGIGVSVRPVRAWIIQRAGAVWTALAGGFAPAAPAVPAAPAETSVSFVPSDGAFTIELSGRPAAGRLVVEAVAGDTARATVLDGSGAEALVVLPSGLRISGPSGSSARYRVLLPARLGPVRVLIGGEAPRVFDPAGPPLQIELGRR